MGQGEGVYYHVYVKEEMPGRKLPINRHVEVFETPEQAYDLVEDLIAEGRDEEDIMIHEHAEKFRDLSVGDFRGEYNLGGSE